MNNLVQNQIWSPCLMKFYIQWCAALQQTRWRSYLKQFIRSFLGSQFSGKATKVGSPPKFPKLIFQLWRIPQSQNFITLSLDPHWTYFWKHCLYYKQGKSEGFESCDRPIVRKRPIWVKIGDVLSRVTLKFDGWPWKTIGHLSFAVSSFVQHFIAIGEFKLELLFGNSQFGSNWTIFRAVWPWNLTCGIEKQ